MPTWDEHEQLWCIEVDQEPTSVYDWQPFDSWAAAIRSRDVLQQDEVPPPSLLEVVRFSGRYYVIDPNEGANWEPWSRGYAAKYGESLPPAGRHTCLYSLRYRVYRNQEDNTP